MIVKWIRANADPTGGFDRAQQRWQRLSGHPGLICQGGGRSLRDRTTAVVVALWADRRAHDDFLDRSHADLADEQRTTYTALTVDLLDVDLHDDPPGPPMDGGLLRTAHCRLRPGRFHHALETQERIWLPAMRDAGMAWALFAHGADETPGSTDTVTVMSWWPDPGDHDRYQRERVADLRRRADATNDFSGVTGDLVELRTSWSVSGSPGTLS